MSQTVNKTPISVHDEFCKNKRQPPPDYTLTSTNDRATGFVYTVKSFGVTTIGKATSKKKAKHAAAQSLINQLRNMESFKFDLIFLNVSSDLVDETKVSSSTSNENKRKTTANTEPETNYIGRLLEHCTKNKLPPASFDIVDQSNQANNKTEFRMKCTVNGVEKQGIGLNKQQAKQRAAMEMLQVLIVPEPSAQDNNSKIDEPPPKRLKLNEESNDTETSSTTCGNNVLPIKIESKGDESKDTETSSKTINIEIKETTKENQSTDSVLNWGHSDDSYDEKTGYESSDDDCQEIIDNDEVYSVESENYSEAESGEWQGEW